jgi:protein farnesyltransferase subunit beta
MIFGRKRKKKENCSPNVTSFGMDDDELYPTETSRLQQETSTLIHELMETDYTDQLYRSAHIQYLSKVTASGYCLSKWFVGLDASKPWIVYWILHSLTLLDFKITMSLQQW